MFGYIVKRLLFFIPTLFVVSLFVFILNEHTPGDPVEKMLKNSRKSMYYSPDWYQREYRTMQRKMNLDKPMFYFSISSVAYPDTLYKIYPKQERKLLEKLCSEYGNWQNVLAFYRAGKELQNSFDSIENPSDEVLEIKKKFSLVPNEAGMVSFFKVTKQNLDILPLECYLKAKNFVEAYQLMVLHKNQKARYIPCFRWYGLENRYHAWVFGSSESKGMLQGNFGTSFKTGEKVSTRISNALPWTLTISVLSILIAFGLSIPLGVTLARKNNTLFDNVVTTVLNLLFAAPNFWVASLLILFFCNPHFFHWFPSSISTMELEGMSFLQKSGTIFSHFVIPVFCWTYGSIAYLSRQMKEGVLLISQSQFMVTALAKGLSKKQAVRKHGVKNALIPMITLFSQVFPFAIAGSVVLEVLFSIPGMGRLTFTALTEKDFPVVFSVILLVTLFSLVGNLIADVLYRWTDPRITFSKTEGR